MTAVTEALPGRRRRGRNAIVAAHARRQTNMRELAPWLASYLVSLTVAPMSDHDIAETVRGLADGWREIQATAEAQAAEAQAASIGADR